MEVTMTKIGIEDIEDRIKRRIITPDDNLNADELLQWLLGYKACQDDVLDILDKFKGNLQ